MPWSSHKFKLWAIIAGEEYEVAHFSSDFGINSIPQATLLLAVGREVKSLKAAASHKRAGDFNVQIPMEVMFSAETLGQRGGGKSHPEGEAKIFEGYVTGVGLQKHRGGTYFQVQAKHWLIDMNFSSALSAESHPNNPADLAFPPGSFAPGEGAGALNFIPLAEAHKRITPATLTSDFWEDGLKPWLIDITKLSKANDIVAPGAPTGGNEAAAKALERITGACSVPLVFDFNGALEEEVAQAISNTMVQETLESFYNYTLWDKLVGQYAQQFLFSIVPRVEDAMVVPLTPGLRETFETEIKGDEDTTLDVSGELPRPLQGVGIWSGMRSRAGVGQDLTPDSFAYKGIGGYFQGRDSGMIIYKQAPTWLAHPIETWAESNISTGAAGNVKGTAHHPGVGPAPQKAKPGDILDSISNLADEFAHSLYVYEILKNRNGSLHGKLRFDICAGSTVRVEGVKEDFTPNDELAKPFIALVTRVSSSLNAESQRCGTSFSLAHLRNEKENEDDATSVERHPLWEEIFTGCALVDDL